MGTVDQPLHPISSGLAGHLTRERAITTALEALARQPEAEKSITRTLFIGLAMIESLVN